MVMGTFFEAESYEEELHLLEELLHLWEKEHLYSEELLSMALLFLKEACPHVLLWQRMEHWDHRLGPHLLALKMSENKLP